MEVEQAKIEEFEVKNECPQEDVPDTKYCLHLDLIRKCFGEKKIYVSFENKTFKSI